jgi:hypothetical protein
MSTLGGGLMGVEPFSTVSTGYSQGSPKEFLPLFSGGGSEFGEPFA